MRLTTRDTEILDALTRRVRVMVVDEQVAPTWWGETRSANQEARKRLRLLDEHLLLEVVRLHVRPIVPLRSPVISWKPGDQEPRFSRASYRLFRRWSDAPRTVQAVIATERAARMFGGLGGALKHPLQASHDIHLAEVFLQFRRADSTLANSWLKEDLLTKNTSKRRRIPDAAILAPDGRMLVGIDFGGLYSPCRIESFHRAFAETGTPYQLW